LRLFGWVFIFFTLLFAPVFYYYGKAAGLQLVSHGYFNSVMMLGNLGFNKAVCVSTYVTLPATEVNFTCEMGTMTNLTYYGILPANSTFLGSVSNYAYCNDPFSSTAPPGTSDCSIYLQYTTFAADFSSACY